jgi:alpha-tubulin suppressor-like RCC1 family protein
MTITLSIAAGDFHSVAAREDGSVVQWGYPWPGVPTDLTNAIAVSAGSDFSLALRRDGTVVA